MDANRSMRSVRAYARRHGLDDLAADITTCLADELSCIWLESELERAADDAGVADIMRDGAPYVKLGDGQFIDLLEKFFKWLFSDETLAAIAKLVKLLIVLFSGL